MKRLIKNFTIIVSIFTLILTNFIIFNTNIASADSYNGQDLAYAILQDGTTLISSSYVDSDQSGNRMAIILSSKGIMRPTDGPTFVLFSTGIAGSDPVTTDEEIPGDERGTCYRNKYGYPYCKDCLHEEIMYNWEDDGDWIMKSIKNYNYNYSKTFKF